MSRKKEELTFRQKARKPQITPVQLFMLILVEIMTVAEGLLPLFFGEPFNPVWFITSFVMNNLAYFVVMSMRGVMFEGKKPMELVQKVIQNVIEILVNKSTNKDEKHRQLITVVKWIMEEINQYYEVQLNTFTDHIRKTYGSDIDALLGFKWLPEGSDLSSSEKLKEALETIKSVEKDLTPEFKQKLIKALEKGK